jgi:thymidine phosphorylase
MPSEDPVSAAAGIICLVKPGERVTKGQAILELRTDDAARFASVVHALDGAVTISDQPPPPPTPLVIERIG